MLQTKIAYSSLVFSAQEGIDAENHRMEPYTIQPFDETPREEIPTGQQSSVFVISMPSYNDEVRSTRTLDSSSIHDLPPSYGQVVDLPPSYVSSQLQKNFKTTLTS